MRNNIVNICQSGFNFYLDKKTLWICHFCQAQLRLALLLILHTHPPTHPPPTGKVPKLEIWTRNASQITVWMFLIGRSPHEDNLTRWKISQEDNLTVRRPHRKKTLREYELTGRRPHRKKALQKDHLTGRQSRRKTASQEKNLTGKQQHSKKFPNDDNLKLSPILFIFNLISKLFISFSRCFRLWIGMQK